MRKHGVKALSTFCLLGMTLQDVIERLWRTTNVTHVVPAVKYALRTLKVGKEHCSGVGQAIYYLQVEFLSESGDMLTVGLFVADCYQLGKRGREYMLNSATNEHAEVQMPYTGQCTAVHDGIDLFEWGTTQRCIRASSTSPFNNWRDP